MSQPSIFDLHSYIQSFQIEAILDVPNREIRTHHFIITQDERGTFTVTEKKLEALFLKSRVVAKEIEMRRQKEQKL